MVFKDYGFLHRSSCPFSKVGIEGEGVFLREYQQADISVKIYYKIYNS